MGQALQEAASGRAAGQLQVDLGVVGGGRPCSCTWWQREGSGDGSTAHQQPMQEPSRSQWKKRCGLLTDSLAEVRATDGERQAAVQAVAVAEGEEAAVSATGSLTAASC